MQKINANAHLLVPDEEVIKATQSAVLRRIMLIIFIVSAYRCNPAGSCQIFETQIMTNTKINHY